MPLALRWLDGRSVGLAVLLLGCMVGGIAWFRLTRITPESDQARSWAREAHRVFESMTSIDLRDRTAVEQAFSRSEVEDPEGKLSKNPERLEQIRSTARGFIVARVEAADWASYVRSMEERGYSLKSIAELNEVMPLKSVARLVGSAGADPRELFEKAWNHAPFAKACPERICVDSKAIVVTVGESNLNRPFGQDVHGSLGFTMWHGAIATGCRLWMRPPVLRLDLIKAHRRVVTAEVAIAVHTRDKVIHPMIVRLFQEPTSGRWWVDSVSVTNFDEDGVVCTDY